MSKAPNRTLTISINFSLVGKINNYDIKYPTVGLLFDIEMMKLRLTDGRYDTLRFSYNPTFIKQADIVDTISTLSVLVPDLKKDILVRNFFDLAPDQIDVLVKVYNDQILPWLTEWDTYFKTPIASEVAPDAE